MQAASQRVDGRSIAIHGANVVVAPTRGNAPRSPTSTQIGVDQGADVFVAAFGFGPQRVERAKDTGRHAEGAPDPLGARLFSLDTDLAHRAVGIGQHRVEM